MKKFFRVITTAFIIVSLQITLPVSGLITNILDAADQTRVIQVSENVFSNGTTGGNWRRFLAIGNFYDTADDNLTYYTNSEAYLKFDLDAIPRGAVVENAYLTVYKYANAGSGFTAELKPLTQFFNETTGTYRNDYRSKGVVYSTAYIDSGDYDFDEIRFNAKDLVQKWINGQPNYGFVIDANAPGYRNGAAVCSSRTDGFCQAQHIPKLTVEYNLNQPPYTPNPIGPANLSEISGGCDESVEPSTGNCRTTTQQTISIDGVGDGDPAPGDYKHTGINFVRTTTTGVQNYNSPNLTQRGRIDYQADFADGKYAWRARSIDNLGAIGNYSPTWNFTVDTTPPSVPEIVNLPEYSSAIRDNTQLDINVSEAIDNVQTGRDINYSLEYSTSPDFAESYLKTWQESRTFEIGPFGADQIEGTADDLVHNTTYYFRTKSRDKVINGVWNTSAWSTSQSTTIDSVKPEITNFTYSIDGNSEYGRFSPDNATSTGEYDTVDFEVEFTEQFPKTAKLEIYSGNTLVRVLENDVVAQTGTEFNWDGKDNNGNSLLDGAYVAKVVVSDLAGNTNEPSQEHIIILDNTDANISLSSPFNGFWTNNNQIGITGQILKPNLDGEEDQDLSIAEYQVNGGNWEEISYDDQYIFEILNLDLAQDITNIAFRTVDTVGNSDSSYYNPSTSEYFEYLTINKDTAAPTLTINLEDGVVLTDQNTFTFTIEDTLSGISLDNPNLDIVLGTNLRLNPLSDIFTFQPDTLYQQGVNVSSGLVEDVTCTTDAPFVSNNQASGYNVECTLTFPNGLPLDTDYRLNITARDNATNEASDQVEFTIDTTAYVELISPNSGVSTSNNYVDLEFYASKDSLLTISNEELGIEIADIDVDTLTVGYSNSLFTAQSIDCSGDLDVDNDNRNRNEDVCLINIRLNQSSSEDGLVENNNIIHVEDQYGNESEVEFDINVDITDFEAEITTNLEYFSPNGDGNQDFVIFSHDIYSNGEEALDLESYNIVIKNYNGDIVGEINGDELGGENIWLAEDSLGNTLADGIYTYTMVVTTTAGVTTETSQKNLFIFTELENEIYITNPMNGSVNSDGVINIEGQAPTNAPTFGLTNFLRGFVDVQICIDNISTPQNCDELITTDVDANGFFTTLAVLPINPDSNRTQFKIAAKAFDVFGNETVDSNIVNITYDIEDPFNFVSITPTLVGGNTEEDYQRFLNGEITIDELRNVRIEAGVSQNTEKVELNFAEGTNLNNLYIGQLTGNESTACTDLDGCTWSTYHPISPEMGGVYEVEFTGYKDTILQTVSAGFRVDGTIPSEAAILSIEKFANGNWYTLVKDSEGQFFINSDMANIRGVADPNTQVQLLSNGEVIGTTTSQANGIWNIELDVSENSDENEFTLNLTVNTVDGPNTTEGTIETVLNYDIQSPELTKIQRTVPAGNKAGWVQTGHSAQYRIETSEKLRFGDLIKEDGYIAQFSEESENTYIVTINVDREREGYYNPTIRLIDRAGNMNQYYSESWEDYGLGDFRLYVDNTDPDATDFDRSEWSTTKEEGGINADGLNPEIGRTSPGYVYRNNTIVMYGFAEKNQRVEIIVNSEVWYTTDIYPYQCQETEEEDTLALDGLVVKYAEKCKWNYTLKFVGDGTNNQFGVPNEYYTIQTRVVDSAANKSAISDPVLIYYDTQAPKPVSVVGFK